MGDLKRHDSALGSSGTDVVGRIHNQDDHIQSLKGFEAALIYDRMRRSDTQIRKVLSAIGNPIKAATWSVEPVSEEAKDLEQAALINQILFKDLNWTKFLNEALTLVPHGYSAFEVVHANKENKEVGAYTGLAQLGFRRQPTITEWYHDTITGNLLGIKQESNGDIQTSAYIPAEFLLLFFSEQEGDNIGFPLLRNLYGPYKRKLLALEINYIGIERFAIPTPILKVPKKVNPGDAEYIAAIDSLKNFTSAEDSYILYPEGWELELHDNMYDPQKVAAIIKTEDENMAGAVLGSFLELGTGGNSGAFALANDLSDFFMTSIVYYAEIIKDTINTCLIPQLMKLNYGDDISLMPELTYSGITDNAGKELMEVITGFTTAGVIGKDEALEDYVRKAFKLPKKADGEMIENQETEEAPPVADVIDEEENSDDDNGSDSDNNNDTNSGGDDSSTGGPPVKLADELGHRHAGTGPTIQKGAKHYHETLDSAGNVIGRTSADNDGAGHTHIKDDSSVTGGPIEIKPIKEAKNNPKAQIESDQIEFTEIIRRNLKIISDKYINDLLRKYSELPANQKLKAPSQVKLGNTAKFRKELRASFTNSATKALDQAKSEVPGAKNVKLSYDEAALLKEFNYDSFKFNDFSKLPKRIQILIASQSDLLSSKEAKDLEDTVAFAFNQSEPSTNDIEVLKQDLLDAADKKINSGAQDVAGANAAATIVNQARNEYLLNDDVIEQVGSFTFVNEDPKTDICKALAGTTYYTDDQDLIRYQPPLHQNCKSYIRANLKTNKNNPEVTGLPPISQSAKKSITFKDEQ